LLLAGQPGQTQLEQDVAVLNAATERFETARAAVAALETKLTAERVGLRAARAALYAAIYAVQRDMAEVAPAPPTPRPIVYREAAPVYVAPPRVIYQSAPYIGPCCPTYQVYP
jgi:hypothetical protein